MTARSVTRKGTWSDSARRILKERYLWRKAGQVVEDEEGLCLRVAAAVADPEANYPNGSLTVEQATEAFYNLLIDRKFMPNSPTLMNAGKDNGQQLSACFVIPVEDSMVGIFDAIKYAAQIHQSGGGCIAGDARVWTTFCGIEPIEVLFHRATVDGRPGVRQGSGVAYDVRDLGIQTASMRPATGETGLRPVTHVWRFDVPAEDQVVVTLREGTIIQTSAWHPFMVVRGTALVEVRADELVAGDVVLGPDAPEAYWPWTEYRTVGSLTVGPDLAWLIGFTLGDGSFGYVPALRQYRVRWFSGTTDVLDRVRSVLAQFGIQASIQQDARGLYSVSTLNQRFVHDLLEACGLEKVGPKDGRIRVPEIISKSPIAAVRAFLAGLLDSDGTVDRDGSPAYSTVSAAMAEDVAALLGLLGYRPSLRRSPQGKARQSCYTVQLCPLGQVAQLAAEIGDQLSNVERRDRLVVDRPHQTRLQLAFPAWRDRLAELGLVTARGDWRAGPGPLAAVLNRWSCNERGRCSRDDLLTVAHHVAPLDGELAGLIERLARRGQEVASVAPAATPKPFYDLSVEEWNTYAAGQSGMVMIHNTGFAFSRLRPKGARVGTTQGVASGPVSFMKVFDAATEHVKQGGTRRGANMGILRVDHPDIVEFIDSKRSGGITNFNISVAITEQFIDALRTNGEYDLVAPHSGEVTGKRKAREIWDKIVDAAWATGDPGLVFIDRANKWTANPVPSLGPLESTNPCVTGDTLVYTADGLVRIDELVSHGITPNVTLDARQLDGLYGPASVPFVTGTKPVFRLCTKEGYEVRLTADHRVMTERGWVHARDLQSGDKLHLLNHKGGFGEAGTESEGRVLGWLIGDGHIKRHDAAGHPTAYLEFWGKDRELAAAFAGYVSEMVPPHPRKGVQPVGVMEIAARELSWVGSSRLAAKLEADFGVTADTKVSGLPSRAFQQSEAFQRGLLQALFTADGTVTGTAEKGVSVRLSSTALPLLKDVQRMLLNFGIASRIYTDRHPERTVVIRGAEYISQPDHELVIGKANVLRFRDEIGFIGETKRTALDRALATYRQRGPYREPFTATFVALEPAGEETVYDLTEPLTHSFVGNGLVLHNCGEQWLYPFDACNLGSINLNRFVIEVDGQKALDWASLEETVRLCVRFLDNVIDINPFPLEQITTMVRNNRRIGLGIMGWADILLMLGIPYDSQEALDLGSRVMEFTTRIGKDESHKLGAERGPFPTFDQSIYRDGPPLRNSTITTIAPTGTISIIADCSSGIEPIFALAFQHKVPQPDGTTRVLTFINPYFEQVARERGFYSAELTQKVLERGSVHGLPEVPEDVQQAFVTAHEIAPEWHVRMQAAFQQHTHNAVSKTINLPNTASRGDVERAYLQAYDSGCLGITVFRDGCKDAQVLNVGVKQDEKAAAAAPAKLPEPALPAEIKSRPAVIRGYTRQIQAPEGNINITINEDQDGPFEVFINVGKAGSDLAAMAEALGRLISLNFRLPSPMSPRERAEVMVRQLRGIGGSRSIGFGIRQVRSLPDALAQALDQHLHGESMLDAGSAASPAPTNGYSAGDKGGYGNGHANGNGQSQLAMPLWTGNLCPQCSCNTLAYEEGCKKCHACGYSEC